MFGDLELSKIKRIILDVLKPHKPSILEIADRLGDSRGSDGAGGSQHSGQPGKGRNQHEHPQEERIARRLLGKIVKESG